MRCENHSGLHLGDAIADFVHRSRGEGCIFVIAQALGLHDDVFVRYVAHLKYLRPTKAEPAVANDQAPLVCGKLPRDCFHAIGAAARNDSNRIGLINLFHGGRYVVHDLLELSRHVIERSVGKNDRKLQQPIWVYVR